MTTLIDDDFDKLVRYVFERMFGRMPLGSEEVFGLGLPSDDAESSSLPTPQSDYQDIRAETVELDDRTVIVVDGIPSNAAPIVRVRGRSVRVENIGAKSDMTFELSFQAEDKDSNASFKNGVLEMEFRRTERTEEDADDGEFTLLG